MVVNCWICLVCLMVSTLGHPPQVAQDSDNARRLFQMADQNQNYNLTDAEFHDIFSMFDIDPKDGVVTSHEFVEHWLQRRLGGPMEAVVLFNHLDVNRDGIINGERDLTGLFKMFDRNGDHSISQSEFVIQWVKISKV
ncbi:hypothetical protein ScPMuIL_010266 [Solemya velum]